MTPTGPRVKCCRSYCPIKFKRKKKRGGSTQAQAGINQPGWFFLVLDEVADRNPACCSVWPSCSHLSLITAVSLIHVPASEAPPVQGPEPHSLFATKSESENITFPFLASTSDIGKSLRNCRARILPSLCIPGTQKHTSFCSQSPPPASWLAWSVLPAADGDITTSRRRNNLSAVTHCAAVGVSDGCSFRPRLVQSPLNKRET